MNTYDHAEQEQLEQLKDWWKRYGIATIVTIVIAVCSGLGWRAWDQAQEKSLEQASQTYEALLASVVSEQPENIDQRANDLIDKHPKTDYAKLAALFLAKQALIKGDLSKAQEQLRWVIDTAKTPSMQQVARIRLARLLLAEKKPEEALSLLEKVDDKFYLPLINVVKGDIYTVTNKLAEARLAYQQALKDLPKTDQLRTTIQMKLDNLQ
jgi:predicted negative regulator of RcsB-dependent stress response